MSMRPIALLPWLTALALAALPDGLRAAPSERSNPATARPPADSAPLPEAAPTSAPPGPCRETYTSIKPGSTDPDAFLRAGACLRRADSTAGADTAARSAVSAEAERLRALLPGSGAWYAGHLERLRARRDISRMLDLAWLAELRDPPGPEVWREVAEAQTLAGHPRRAAYAQLKQAEQDSTQAGYIQYQLDNLLRSLTDTPAPALLDSLSATFPHRKAVTAEILESLCQQHRAIPAAYRGTLAWLVLRKPAPGAILERAERYHAFGRWDYADGVLEKGHWRSFPKPMQGLARALWLRARYRMEDWKAIAAETAGLPKGSLTDEEDCLVATALVRLGRPQDALDRLARLESRGESEWGYRAQFLKARALLSLGRPAEASRALETLKRGAHRREGTGPILFWQGWLALHQRRIQAADSLLVLASAYTGTEESQRALEYRYWLVLDTGSAATDFFRGLAESPLSPADRSEALDKVPESSLLWPHARLEKAQILVAEGQAERARAVLDTASRRSQDRILAGRAEALAAWLREKTPEGRAAALARYENLLIEYQQGVVPEFTRGRIRALK